MTRRTAFAVGLCTGALITPISYELVMHTLGRNSFNPPARRK